MTEFETATLAYQATAPAYQATALAYQATALSYQYAGLWISAGVGAAQCLLIGSGLWVMHRGMQRRDMQNAEVVAAQERRHAEYMANHEETMKVLNANLRALERQGEALREQSAVLREQGAALHLLVERSGPGIRN